LDQLAHLIPSNLLQLFAEPPLEFVTFLKNALDLMLHAHLTP
jgi:hypothetical protein